MSEKKMFSGDAAGIGKTDNRSSSLSNAKKAVFPGKYIQGEGLIQELPLKGCNSNCAAFSTPKSEIASPVS